ncbi:MAG TPA: nuclear transport factor 2 family protein [Thermoanaerobaculia bacterium]
MSAPRRWFFVYPLLVLLACTAGASETAEDVGARNTELARSGYDAFARGDVPVVLGLMSPEIIWHEAESLPYGGIHRGPDAVLQNVFMGLGRDWQPFAATPKQYIPAGDHVVVLGEYSGTNRVSGRAFVAPFAHIWRFENGRLVEFRQLTDTAKWLEAIDAVPEAPAPAAK